METKLRSVLLFDVGADVPHRLLTEATDAGVAAARASAGGLVDANGALGSARDDKRRVRVELALRATPAAAMEAERAFAAAFAATLETKGHAVERV
ncbi:MAG TPA: hypothetical protein VM582_10390 [Candidatus Thermoplasmatota archaeon]|nr:hypothetical protein [Candidatus Thermoplasmatota archaeon]